MPLYSMLISISYSSPRSHFALVGFFAALHNEDRTAFSSPTHRIGGPPIPNNLLSTKFLSSWTGIGGPPIPSLEFSCSRHSMRQLEALLCHVSFSPYFDNLLDILGIGGPPIPYLQGSTAHFVLLTSSLINVYPLDSFYAPVGIGGSPILGARSMQSGPSEAVLHQLSIFNFLMWL